METLQIDKANALKAHEEASIKGKSLLENLFGKKVFLKDVKDRIKNFDDVLAENGISREDFETSCKGLEPDEIAYRMAKLVCIAFNEGWLPDWTNSNEYKYAPYFRMGSSSGVGFSYHDYDVWAASSGVGSRLCFKSSDLASHAGKLFEQEIYKPLFTI
ncbi:hypothetical protein ACM55H_05385 [Flavobacterium sp. ZT3R17]|uniref:hypothetical protein n=1 Tax=Flavobacterium cryoconiti TaxID=3398736 RepID=UPI003A880DB8